MTVQHFLLSLPAAAAFVLLAPALAPAADTAVVRGPIVKVDAAAKSVTVRPNGGGDVTLAVTDASRLEAGGKPATLAQFKEGQRVRATYAEKTKQVVSLKPAVTTDEDLGREVKQALAAVKDYTFRQKDKYAAELREVADDVEDRIDHLEARAKEAGAEAKAKIQTRITELRKKKGELNARLEKVGTATAEAWDDVKSGVGEAAAELEKVLNRLFKD